MREAVIKVARRRVALLALIVAVLFAVDATAQPARRGPLVLAAASLQEAMTAVADDWARAGHLRPVVSFAGSSALARQVEAGAPADLFVSADEAWMDELARRGLLAANSRTNLAGNRLVIIAGPRGRAIDLRDRAGTARTLSSGVVAMADPTSVPAGRYGRIALQRLGIWQAVGPRVVRAENVRAALALVERGAAPFGIVYATDARQSRRVRVAAVFPAASHPPITYPVARLARSRDPDAEPFRHFLLSRRGRAILARFGFVVG